MKRANDIQTRRRSGLAALALVVGASIGWAAPASATVTVALGPPESLSAFNNNPTGLCTACTTSSLYGPITFTGIVANGSSGAAAEPFGDTSNYVYASPGSNVSVAFNHPLNSVELYWGSIDSVPSTYNLITLSNGDTFSAASLLGLGGAPGDGDQGATNSLWVKISDTNAFSGFTASASQVAFEFEVASVPEPSTWALMLLGFAGLGFAGYRSSRKRLLVGAQV